MYTANAIEMLAATRTPSRFVEEVRRDDPLTAECVGGHSRTLAQATIPTAWNIDPGGEVR